MSAYHFFTLFIESMYLLLTLLDKLSLNICDLDHDTATRQ